MRAQPGLAPPEDGFAAGLPLPFLGVAFFFVGAAEELYICTTRSVMSRSERKKGTASLLRTIS